MSAKPSRNRVTFDLEPSERKRLQAEAASNERTLAQELRLAVREYLDKIAKRRR